MGDDYHPYNSTSVNLTLFELLSANGESAPSEVDALQYVTTYDVYHLIETAVLSHARDADDCFAQHCNLTRPQLNRKLKDLLVNSFFVASIRIIR